MNFVSLFHEERSSDLWGSMVSVCYYTCRYNYCKSLILEVLLVISLNCSDFQENYHYCAYILCIFVGAGKTSTFSMLTGELSPSSGTAIIAGHDIRTSLRKVFTLAYVDIIHINFK